MQRTNRGRERPPIHAQVIEAIMEAEGLNQVDVIHRAADAGRFTSVDTLRRALDGATPNTRNRAAIAAGLSDPDAGHVINSRQLFGAMPLPTWVVEIVYGQPADLRPAVAA